MMTVVQSCPRVLHFMVRPAGRGLPAMANAGTGPHRIGIQGCFADEDGFGGDDAAETLRHLVAT